METIKVPDSWDEVTIGQYQELLESKKDFERVSVLIDQDPEDVRKYDPQSMARILKHLSWTQIPPDQNRYNRFIEVDGVEYRLVHNLNSFTLGEWIDMDEYVKDFNNNLHLVIAMLYRPAGEYRAEDVAGRANLFRDKVSIGQVYGAFVFFSLVATKSMLTTQLYSIRKLLIQMKQNMRKKKGWLKKGLQESGAGITMPTAWPKGT